MTTLTIDLESEDLMTFRQAETRIPGRKKVSNKTLHRWRLKGFRGITLEAVRVGLEWQTSTEAIQRFIERQNPQPTAAPETPARRMKRNEAAKAELRRMGVGTQ